MTPALGVPPPVQTTALSREHGFDYYRAWGTSLLGWAHASEGRTESGITCIRRGPDRLLATGAELRRPYDLGLLAEATAGAGRPGETLAIVDEALGKSTESGERWRRPAAREPGCSGCVLP